MASTDDAIVVDGKEYKVYAEKDANNIPWVKNDGVEFVLECTGFYTSAEKSQAHLNAGAKKVLISAPAKDETTPTVVFGVNHGILKASDNIVSAGSCTTNSMAAMVKLLNDKFGIKLGFMTTIHAYTGTQMILDGPRFPKARNNRAAAINTIPHSTGAAKAIGKVVPEVNGKLQGHAQRIQVPDGSITELTTVLNKEVTADGINAAFKEAFSNTEYYGYNEDGIVSSDIIGDTHGGVFDPTQTDVNTVDGTTDGPHRVLLRQRVRLHLQHDPYPAVLRRVSPSESPRSRPLDSTKGLWFGLPQCFAVGAQTINPLSLPARHLPAG